MAKSTIIMLCVSADVTFGESMLPCSRPTGAWPALTCTCLLIILHPHTCITSMQRVEGQADELVRPTDINALPSPRRGPLLLAGSAAVEYRTLSDAQRRALSSKEILIEQVKVATAASPSTTVWVYRNGLTLVHTVTLVREKVIDPKYDKWFMHFSDEAITDKTTDPKMHAKMCDSSYNPPRCSDLYHDHAQTPGYPKGDGDCAPLGCGVRDVPISEYLFDPRAANVSIDVQTFAEWYVDDYLFGPTGACNPNISGFYFDHSISTTGP